MKRTAGQDWKLHENDGHKFLNEILWNTFITSLLLLSLICIIANDDIREQGFVQRERERESITF